VLECAYLFIEGYLALPRAFADIRITKREIDIVEVLRLRVSGMPKGKMIDSRFRVTDENTG
jgi:hypothetical protein